MPASINDIVISYRNAAKEAQKRGEKVPPPEIHLAKHGEFDGIFRQNIVGMMVYATQQK